jgi:hypothetical protein
MMLSPLQHYLRSSVDPSQHNVDGVNDRIYSSHYPQPAYPAALAA